MTDEKEIDYAALHRFSAAMQEKLDAAREKGRSGWHDPDQCGTYMLCQMLIEHMDKGNPGTFEDIANFCMMLHQRGDDPKTLALVFREIASEIAEEFDDD